MLSQIRKILLMQIRTVTNKSRPVALKAMKKKSSNQVSQYFIDERYIRAIGGKGGDGCISLLRVWANEFAGPDGGDGGNGAHVVLEASTDVNDFKHISSVLEAPDGENGMNKDCHGKNAPHKVVRVPIGTIVKNIRGEVVGDLEKEGVMFVAARGGAGGKGNHFFSTSVNKTPEVCEYGASGEDVAYTLELRSMAHVGFIGLPNAGKSTLLRMITRAKPKIASYPFTTLKPHLGMIPYDDYEQISVADLPGLISGSADNRGLGIQFLKHAERCNTLLFVIDVSLDEPWEAYYILTNEINKFSEELMTRKQIIAANKIDEPGAEENLKILREKFSHLTVVGISAKFGTNITQLLDVIRENYDEQMESEKLRKEKDEI
ncbi:CLUMA_CG014342, isoform A [Clunio marinus]|uniref:CLUMA_CG014342, isoform A n=1 Tax=Clunio marinus TaxID=568069 RepID=A0A1J1IMX9_9DIPT|nr:CLUMA_CG014342, isoform A [Clunio marinus]